MENSCVEIVFTEPWNNRFAKKKQGTGIIGGEGSRSLIRTDRRWGETRGCGRKQVKLRRKKVRSLVPTRYTLIGLLTFLIFRTSHTVTCTLT